MATVTTKTNALATALAAHKDDTEKPSINNIKRQVSLNRVDIEYKGSNIILPDIDGKAMSLDEGISCLRRKKEEEEQEYAVNHSFVCAPLDGAVAFQKAIALKYGWANGVTVPPGFFRPEQPPRMVGVAISATETIQVPWGRLEIPGIEGFLETHLYANPKPHFLIGGKVKKKHAAQINELVALTKKFLAEESIYKGKAIKISFDYDPDDFDPTEHCPHFMNLKGVHEDDLIFGEKVINDLTIGLFTPIEQAEACRQVGVPLKRGILLYGPYGTGKTMTAHVAALKAVRNGWTFIYLDQVADLKQGLQFAAQYAPAVVFAEDIDRAVTGDRTMSMDDILNTLDGVDTKGAEVITVLTTNHIEQINPAMLRMGRLDTLVEVLPPDEKAAIRLVKLYARGLLAKDVDLNKLGKMLTGKIPAFIREVTERAKIAAIGRIKGGDIAGKVQQADLIAAAEAMEPHALLLEPKESGNVLSAADYFVKVPEVTLRKHLDRNKGH